MCSDISKLNKVRQETEEEQGILALNAWHLARYVIEHDHEIEVPEAVDMGQFMLWSENYPTLSPEEKIKFVNHYALLEKAAKNVTARTLVATRIHGRGFIHAVFYTSVGKHLLFLSLVTLMFVLLLLANTMWPAFRISPVLTPFFAAGLGACVFLLRITQEKLKNRQFDPARIPSHMIRLGLGILAGGTIVFFPELFTNVTGSVDKASDATVVGMVELGRGAVAFLFGYAVDMFYAVLDRIGGKQIKGD